MILGWLPAIIGLISALAGLISIFIRKNSFLRSSSIYYLSSAIIFTAIFYIAKVDTMPENLNFRLASYQNLDLSNSITVQNSFVAASTALSEPSSNQLDNFVTITILSYPKAKVYISQEYRGKTPLTIEVPKAVSIPFTVKVPISPIGQYEVYNGILNESKDSTINVWLKQR